MQSARTQFKYDNRDTLKMKGRKRYTMQMLMEGKPEWLMNIRGKRLQSRENY